MQNQFVGDIGDYAKYALLRQLSVGRKLEVAWYLHPDNQNADGGFIQYLGAPEIWRDLDPPLFDGLKEIICNWFCGTSKRSVMDIQRRHLLPGAVFAGEPLDSGRIPANRRELWRRKWFDRAEEKLRGCRIVFADPDNGLCHPGNFDYVGGNDSWQRLPLGEALGLSAGRPTVIYHHYTRFPRGPQGKDGPQAEIEYWMQQIPNCTHAFRCRRRTNRTFFVLNGEPIAGNLIAFVNRWRNAEARAGINDDRLSYLFPLDDNL